VGVSAGVPLRSINGAGNSAKIHNAGGPSDSEFGLKVLMMKTLKMLVGGIALSVAVLLQTIPCAQAGTIIKLSLGDDAIADVEFSGGPAGVLSTADDFAFSTSGDQNTSIEFLGDFDFISDIMTGNASYSLNGITATGPAINNFGFITQFFSGGNFQIWDAANTLLLDVNLGGTVLFGQLGNSQGGAINTTFGTTTGLGLYDSLIIPNTVGMTISLASIKTIGGPNSLSGTPAGPGLTNIRPFNADASKIITAGVIPEPTTAILLVLGAMAASLAQRRR
jgi:hypothetical protein